jgi:ribosome recycling factor
MPINQLAAISTPEARLISVQVWDKENTKAVEKAIRDAGLGLNPQSEGTVIRVPVPELSAERRAELAKVAGKYAEGARVSVRNVRRDGMDTLKKLLKDKELSEDDEKRQAKHLQEETDNQMDMIFNKKRADDRKEWLKEYDRKSFLNTSHSRLPWIHNDDDYYTAIIYLSPNAPEISGTSIFKPIRQNENMSHFSFDKTKCIEIDRIGNVFNRLIIFDASNYHYPNNYFGIDKEDGRLTQVMWFNIKPKHHHENSFIKDNNIHVYKDTIIKSSYPCGLNPKHGCDFIVIDNFYENPLNVREFALSQKFDTTGNFPGERTQSLSLNDIFKKIQGYIYQYSSNNTYIDGYYSAFQYTTSKHQSWVHIDNNNEWAGILYLTPDAPVTSGTTFYEFYDKYASQDLMNKYSKDMTKWKEIDIVGNIFNRLILFNSKRYHMSRDYFGTDVNNGRLFQVFFI